MSVDVSAVLSVIADMLPGVAAVGVAALGVRAATEAFRYLRDVLGVGGPDPSDANDPRNYEEQGAEYGAGAAHGDLYNNDRVNALHAENAWDSSWDQ